MGRGREGTGEEGRGGDECSSSRWMIVLGMGWQALPQVRGGLTFKEAREEETCPDSNYTGSTPRSGSSEAWGEGGGGEGGRVSSHAWMGRHTRQGEVGRVCGEKQEGDGGTVSLAGQSTEFVRDFGRQMW